MTLLSATSELNITFADGVYPKDTKDYSIPSRAEWLKEGEFACYRAHANVWRKVIQEGWQTALILESDADWDVALKDQTTLISQHMEQAVSMHNKNATAVTESDPYGSTNWDLLIFGSCLETPRNDGKVVQFADPSTPPMSIIPEWGLIPLKPYYKKDSDEQVRLVPDTDLRRFLHKSPGTVCTTSYAVSRRGAMRLLHTLTDRGYFAQVDLAIRDMIWNNQLDAYTVIPPIMSQWKYTDTTANSDIGDGRAGGAPPESKRNPGDKTFSSSEYFRNSRLLSIHDSLW